MGRLAADKLTDVAVLLNVDAESDGSRLPARGVINPPPSILIGIMNSRGLFLIGWFAPPLTLIVLFVALVPVVVAVSVSESLVDWRDNDPRKVLPVDERCCWLGIPDEGGLTIGIKCSLACGSRLVARCMHVGVNGVAVECSAMGALRRSGTWCCISVEKRMGLAWGGVVGSVLMSSWISVLPTGFLRGNVFDLSTISARLVFTPPETS